MLIKKIKTFVHQIKVIMKYAENSRSISLLNVNLKVRPSYKMSCGVTPQISNGIYKLIIYI